MKTITFLRHSKSSWDYILEDVDRPLNEVGIEKIKKVAESSKHQFINSDIIFSSTANRAIHTCLILTRQLSISNNKIRLSEDLYTFNHFEVFDFIKKIEDKYSQVVLVGHNPAYTEISNYFSENKILNLPTARWFSMKFDSNKWSDILKLKPTSYTNNLKSGI
ncbi:MAG: histidine phosphatase family protein [Cryomorphaceae bacterium MED-G11]|jgi:phosphohistidine phosphatase|nr:MAG: histidine phosphatase family protein [Cryomorphaceae bacterium MED-G11]|tara:strand:- start:1201 stop:1689 length:489 start_codon:yes stop_codon:yes gene_type:complete